MPGYSVSLIIKEWWLILDASKILIIVIHLDDIMDRIFHYA